MLRRVFLTIISIILGLIMAYVICTKMKVGKFVFTVSNMIEISKVMLGIWGTLLGFIVTAESILVAFGKGTITNEFKQTGHYMTVIYQYTQTSIKLLLYILMFICIIVRNIFTMTEMFLFILCVTMTFVDIFISLIILIFMLKMAHK